jgi:dihydrofolate reductase
MTRYVAYIAASLDGYIADANGGIEWLERANAVVPAGEDFGYGRFIAGIDAMAMGRRTFEQVTRFASWPYGALPVLVLSRTLSRLPGEVPTSVQLFDRPLDEFVAMATARGYRTVYVDGGQLIQSFLAAGLLDEITVTRIPVLLGGGTPLFGPLPAPLRMELAESRAYPFGYVQTTYRRG